MENTMNNLIGTNTQKNIKKAIEEESLARCQYHLFAEKAKEDGYEQIAAIFEDTAFNEQEHAKIWYKILEDGNLPSTADNLESAAKSENEAWAVTYQDFAREAMKEELPEIAGLFRKIAEIERGHEMRFRKLLANVETGSVFEKDDVVVWQCVNCGDIDVGKMAPLVCPVCGYPQGYFQLKCENY